MRTVSATPDLVTPGTPPGNDRPFANQEPTHSPAKPPNPIEQPSSYWVELLNAQTHLVRNRYVTRVVEIGDGFPLILLHGTGGHAENYARNLVRLGGHHRAIAMDFLWHGRSQSTGFNPEVLPPLVDQVRDVADSLGLERFHLEGQSLGGWVAMLFALKYPTRVAKLVLTTPMGFGLSKNPTAAELAPALAAREQTLGVLDDPSDANVRKRLSRIVFDPDIITDEAVAVRASFYRDPAINQVQKDLAIHYLGGIAPLQHAVSDEMAARISQPTLVYWGDKNPTPESVGRRLASLIPNCRFFCAPNTGHWAQFESHALHDREVLSFLGDDGPSRSPSSTN